MTQEPDQPSEPPTKDAKGRFLPGNKVARGRPRGSENKFGPGFRDKLLAGIAGSGTRKPRKPASITRSMASSTLSKIWSTATAERPRPLSLN